MRKKIAAIFLAGSMVLSVWGCGTKEPGERPTSPGTEIKAGETETSPETEAPEPETEEGEILSEESSVFAELKGVQFTFSSGVGGWATYLHINADGTFSGEYFDGELGDTGEGYPDGTIYQSDFTGTFTEPVKVNDDTYCIQIQQISYEKEPGTEEIIDGMRYCYVEPNGLNAALTGDILLYRPNAPIAELPEDYLFWVGYSSDADSGSEDTGLPFWGLYNVAEECGFESYNIIDNAKQMVDMQKENAASLEKSLKAALSQTEMNDLSYKLYKQWDYALNSIWDMLKLVLEEDAMNSLLTEQREWIAMKEQAAKEAGAEVEGGSAQPMFTNLEAAELTESRVYELLELLEQEGV